MNKLLPIETDTSTNASAVEKLQETLRVITQDDIKNVFIGIHCIIQAVIHSFKGHIWNLWSYINYNCYFLYIKSACPKSGAILLAKVVDPGV